MYINDYQCDEQVETFFDKVNLKLVHLNELKHVLYLIDAWLNIIK